MWSLVFVAAVSQSFPLDREAERVRGACPYERVCQRNGCWRPWSARTTIAPSASTRKYMAYGYAATRLVGFRHERTGRPEGSSRCTRLSHRRHSRTPPQVPRVVLRTCAESQGLHPLLQVGKQHVGSLSCQQLPANLGPGARCSGLNASSPSRSSSDRLSHNAIARSARSPGGASTVARVRWIPWRDSLMQHPLRQAGAMVHEPTRVKCDGCQANPSDLGSELK